MQKMRFGISLNGSKPIPLEQAGNIVAICNRLQRLALANLRREFITGGNGIVA